MAETDVLVLWSGILVEVWSAGRDDVMGGVWSVGSDDVSGGGADGRWCEKTD